MQNEVQDADPDHRSEVMDGLTGPGKVPYYLFFNVGSLREITSEQRFQLERQFYGERCVDRFDLELHRPDLAKSGVGNLLRVRRADKRRLTAVIGGEVFRLVAFYDARSNLTVHF